MQALPRGTGEVGAGFDGDGKVRDAGDLKDEIISLHAETGATAVQQWIPQDGGVAGERRPPTGATSEVIGCRGSAIEHKAATECGSIAPEKYT